MSPSKIQGLASRKRLFVLTREGALRTTTVRSGVLVALSLFVPRNFFEENHRLLLGHVLERLLQCTYHPACKACDTDFAKDIMSLANNRSAEVQLHSLLASYNGPTSFTLGSWERVVAKLLSSQTVLPDHGLGSYALKHLHIILKVSVTMLVVTSAQLIFASMAYMTYGDETASIITTSLSRGVCQQSEHN
eukprot:1054556-Amphidinium_carterae.1